MEEEDRNLTTFITEFNRYRYRTGPQGFVASGNGYNQRFNNIIADTERIAQIVDDSCLWDEEDNMELHWWRVIDFLILLGKMESC